MIHHKTYEAYRTLAATCAAKCKGLSKAKGFVTDGEEALSRAFEDELKNTRSLRCFKHFETNCKEKLRAIGIREAKEQRFFMQRVFGVPARLQLKKERKRCSRGKTRRSGLSIGRISTNASR